MSSVIIFLICVKMDTEIISLFQNRIQYHVNYSESHWSLPQCYIFQINKMHIINSAFNISGTLPLSIAYIFSLRGEKKPSED